MVKPRVGFDAGYIMAGEKREFCNTYCMTKRSWTRAVGCLDERTRGITKVGFVALHVMRVLLVLYCMSGYGHTVCLVNRIQSHASQVGKVPTFIY